MKIEHGQNATVQETNQQCNTSVNGYTVDTTCSVETILSVNPHSGVPLPHSAIALVYHSMRRQQCWL